jgi:hypothetical protein
MGVGPYQDTSKEGGRVGFRRRGEHKREDPNHGHAISEILEVDSFELLKGREGDPSGNTLRDYMDGSARWRCVVSGQVQSCSWLS